MPSSFSALRDSAQTASERSTIKKASSGLGAVDSGASGSRPGLQRVQTREPASRGKSLAGGDDPPDGADPLDAPRITPLVASPWAKRGAVVSDHYDDLSVKRTIEIALGMQPSYLYDALAAPMWDVFPGTADNRPYDAADIPETFMEEQNGPRAAMA